MRKYSNNSNLYLLDPIPVWKRKLTSSDLGEDLELFNKKLIDISKSFYSEWETEVPDERHVDTKSILPRYEFERMDKREFFEHPTSPAVGKWHLVPTNNFLNIEEPEVQKLKSIILSDYKKALEEHFDFENEGTKFGDSTFIMDESWLQFYKNGDYKVLHNHLRYDLSPTEHRNIWAGGYYIHDGNPDIHQPYSGRFSFSTRNKSYMVKPESGLIMIWPGDILHEVHPFYGSTERICINFNLSTRP